MSFAFYAGEMVAFRVFTISISKRSWVVKGNSMFYATTVLLTIMGVFIVTKAVDIFT